MLTGKLEMIHLLSDSDIEKMFNLMGTHYELMTFSKFREDLLEKDGAIVLRNERDEIEGFSTYKFITTNFKGDEVASVFSGDTIINKEYWGSPALFNTFGLLLYKLMNDNKGKKCYWFLISKGYRTYFLLPLYFEIFYPRVDKETPEYEKGLIRHLAELKYPEAFIPELGIIKAKSDYLK